MTGDGLIALVSPPVSLHTLVGGWRAGVPNVVGLAAEAVVTGWYLFSVRRLAARGRRWSRWRTASFTGGMLLVVVAVQSGFATYDDSVFELHAVQHLLLMSFAPLLLVLGAPVTLALQASSRRTQQRLLKVLRAPVVEMVTYPALVACVAYASMVVYFLSPLYALSLEHPWLHDLFHLHFLVTGYVFWWLVVGLDPSRWRLSYPAKLAYLAAGIPVNAILGVALTGAHRSIAPSFHSLADTRAGGSVLWIAGELVSVVAVAIVVYQWMRYEEREADRADRRLDAQQAARPVGPPPERAPVVSEARDS